jgi:hypothetical protein
MINKSKNKKLNKILKIQIYNVNHFIFIFSKNIKQEIR